jgi:hypothetical protein
MRYQVLGAESRIPTVTLVVLAMERLTMDLRDATLLWCDPRIQERVARPHHM